LNGEENKIGTRVNARETGLKVFCGDKQVGNVEIGLTVHRVGKKEKERRLIATEAAFYEGEKEEEGRHSPGKKGKRRAKWKDAQPVPPLRGGHSHEADDGMGFTKKKNPNSMVGLNSREKTLSRFFGKHRKSQRGLRRASRTASETGKGKKKRNLLQGRKSFEDHLEYKQGSNSV